MTASPAERIRLILEVVPGERPLEPEFGWRGHLLDSIETPVERALAGVLAESALERWAPDLGVQRVDVKRAGAVEVELKVYRCGEVTRVRVTRRGLEAGQRA